MLENLITSSVIGSFAFCIYVVLKYMNGLAKEIMQWILVGIASLFFIWGLLFVVDYGIRLFS